MSAKPPTHFSTLLRPPLIGPAAASTLEAVSTSTDDDTGGIGALTATVSGLLAGFLTPTDEAITMDGIVTTTATTAVFLKGQRL